MQLVLANSEGECGCMHVVHCSHQGRPNDSPRFVCSATHHHHHSMDLSGRAAYGMARQGSPPSCCEIECHFKGTARTHSPLSLRFSTDPIRAEAGPGFSFSFSGQIPVFTGNEISFRNFGKFRSEISVNFGRNLLNFEFENEIFRKIPKFRIP